MESPWLRYPLLVLFYIVLLPLVKALDVAGLWPRLLARGATREFGRFGEYEPTEHDIFVCSYFKSGTNWTMQIAQQIAHRGRAEFGHIHDVVAWPDAPARARLAIPVTDPSPWCNSPTGLRVIKTHLARDGVPYSPASRYICVVRDPKDVFVSGFYFIRDVALGSLMPALEAWLDAFLSADTPFGSWAEHLHSYWQIRDRDNVLFLTYEEMKVDPAEAVRRIAEVMGVELSADEFAAVVERSTFGYMKQIAHKFDPLGAGPPWVDARGVLLRRGERGAAAELLSPAQRRRVDDYWRAELERLGCDFPYDVAFSVSGDGHAAAPAGARPVAARS